MKRVVEISMTLAALAVFASSDASAIELGTRATDQPFHSAQDFALEFRFSPYRAQVDDDPALGGAKPLEKSFGTAPRLSIAVEFDWQVLRIPYIGTIGPGLGLGFVTMSRNVKTDSGRDSGDETKLTIFPLYAVAVLRADAFWRGSGIPLVPYGKAGLAVGFWRASNSGGTASYNNVAGKGTSWGTNFAVGMAFALDALDPGASRNMDNATGINSTYLFIEGYWLTLDGLGVQKAPLQVGTDSWAAGLAFEF
jgi:hypothetical protein